VSTDSHEVGLGLLIAASIISLLLVVAKALGKEFQDVALVWIRVFKKLRAEWQKPIQLPPKAIRQPNHPKRK
jgi:hypothetical protein